jgi:hypothetical protein
MLQFSATTGVSCCNKECCGWKLLRPSRAHQINHATLQRFTKRFERVAAKLPNLIKDQQSTVSPCQLTRSEAWPAADETGNGEVMVRHAQRWACAATPLKSRGRTDRPHFGRFIGCEIWQHTVERTRQH